MLISNINSKWQDKSVFLSAKIKPSNWDSEPLDLWYEINGISRLPLKSGDPFLAGFLLPCMYEQEELVIEAPVSDSLLKNVINIQNIMSGWYAELKRIKIKSSIYNDSFLKNDSGNKTACFFSGGVDSSFTLASHIDEISHLIFIWGFDIKLDNEILWEDSLARVKETANQLGKKLITVKTNLRTLADKKSSVWGERYNGDFWGKVLHGSALASVGLCLQDNLNHIIIASSGAKTAKDLYPWGSHPELDIFWSNKKIKFCYDFLQSRLGKMHYLSEVPLLVEKLRVCYSNKSGKVNCGCCEKCIRTIILMKLSGIEPNKKNFDRLPSIKEIKTCKINPDTGVYNMWLQMLDEARFQKNVELINAILVALGKKFSIYRFVKLNYKKNKLTIKKFIKIILKKFLKLNL